MAWRSQVDALIEKSETTLDFQENVKLVKQIQIEVLKKYSTTDDVIRETAENLGATVMVVGTRAAHGGLPPGITSLRKTRRGTTTPLPGGSMVMDDRSLLGFLLPHRSVRIYNHR